MSKIRLLKEPNLETKHNAFAYQCEAVCAIRDLEYAAVFHEQGLGKSKIAIDLMLYWLEEKVIDTVLFVAKKTLIRNWEKEFGLHTYMKPKILSNNKSANYYAFNSPSRLMLAHYEVFKSERERMNLFLKTRDVAVILDESAKIKNPDSTLTEVFFELAKLFKKRVIMTGTPVANRPYDIWAQVWFLDQGESLGNNFSEFKHNSDLTNDMANNPSEQVAFETNVESVFSRISRFSVRETKNSGVIELPEKIIKTVCTDWESSQFDMYRQIRDEARAIIVKEGIPKEDISDDILKKLLRLVQVASNPLLIDDSYVARPGKLEVLIDIISEITCNQEKCIVWSSFVKNVDWLARELGKFGCCKIHGKMNIEHRNAAVETFLSDEKTQILIATPGAAKEGLTLTAANHVVFYDRTFSLDDYLQAQDRIHRISQNKKCYVYNLIMKDSVDEWVDVLLNSKHLAAQLTQGDISLEYYRSQMSYEFGDIIREVLGT
jgi:SNF2 family DNA or RNA helicase